jgi:hypothetical protein
MQVNVPILFSCGTRPRGDEYAVFTVVMIGHRLDLHILQMGKEPVKEVKAAGFHTRRAVQHNRPRGRSLMIGFLVEPDHYAAAAIIRGVLRNRDHRHTHSR